MPSQSYNPSTDMPSQSGRVFLITGGTTGLGAGSIKLLAEKSPSHIFFSGRNASRAHELISSLSSSFPNTKLTFLECDLTSLSSVQSAAQSFLAQSHRLDVLMCNAGVMALPPGTSEDGYEIQFATNHLGHALLIKLLLPTMLRTQEQGGDVRIVNLSSSAHMNAPSCGIQFSTLKSDQANLTWVQPGKWIRYGQSKFANLVYAQELARRYPTITTVAVHPGFIKTELHGNENWIDRQLVNFLSGGNWISVEEGPYTQVWAATAKAVQSGKYYEPVAKDGKVGHKAAMDAKVGRELWTWTEEALKEYEL